MAERKKTFANTYGQSLRYGKGAAVDSVAARKKRIAKKVAENKQKEKEKALKKKLDKKQKDQVDKAIKADQKKQDKLKKATDKNAAKKIGACYCARPAFFLMS